MSDDQNGSVDLTFNHVTMKRLRACAEWRGVSIEDLARAYVEDWIDIDYAESQGRLTRRGIHRDGPIGLCEHTRRTASRNWIKDLGEEAP